MPGSVSDETERQPLLPQATSTRAPPSILVLVQNELFGYSLMVLSNVCFSLMWLVTRLVTGYHGFSVASVLFLRGCIQTGLGLLATPFLGNEAVFTVPREIRAPLVVRGVLGATALSMYLTSISKFSCIVSGLLLGEGLNSVEIVAAAVSFLGIVLVSDPLHAAALVDTSRRTYIVGCSVALLAAIVASTTYTTLRSIAPRIHYMTSVLSLGSCLLIFGIIGGGASSRELGRNLRDTAVTSLGCVAGFFGQCALSAGYQHCRAGTGALVRNLDLPFVFILSAVFLSEVPRISSVIGASLVVAATATLAFMAFRSQQNRNSASTQSLSTSTK